MSARAFWLLLLLAAAVGAAALWLVPAREEAPKAEKAALLAIEPGAVRRIVVEGGERTIALARGEDARWQVDGSPPREADPRSVEGLLDALSAARVERAVEGDASEFGLDPAERTVRLFLAGDVGERTVRLGRPSPVGWRRYVRVDDGPSVLVGGEIGTAVERPPEDYVERRLLPVDANRVRRLVVDSPTGRLVVARDGSDWSIEEPFRDRADLAAVESRLRALASVSFDAIFGESRELSGPVLSIELEEGAERSPRRARVAAKRDELHRLAAREPGPAWGTIEEAKARDLEIDPESLRDRRVAPISNREVREIRWREAGAELLLRRQAEGAAWERVVDGAGTPVADPSTVEGLLDAVRWLAADSFERGAAPASTATLAVRGAEGNLATLEFAPSGKGVAIRSAERPGIAAIVSRDAYEAVRGKAKALAS